MKNTRRTPKLALIYTTVATEKQAQSLCDQMVEQRLAGCVQIIGPIRSVYLWKGRKTSSRETGMLIKTSRGRLKNCVEWIQSNHPYETPLILQANAVSVAQDYFIWLTQELEIEVQKARSNRGQKEKR